jgi:hypothetical protein
MLCNANKKLSYKRKQKTKSIRSKASVNQKGKQKPNSKHWIYLWLSLRVMYSLTCTRLRLENHLRLPVMWRKHSESFSSPPTCSIESHRIGKRLNTGVSKLWSKPVLGHLPRKRVSWKTTHPRPRSKAVTTKGKMWSTEGKRQLGSKSM